MAVDAELRLLAAKLINLREEYGSNTKVILRNLPQTGNCVLGEKGKSIFRINFLSLWPLIFAVTVALWWPFAKEWYNNPNAFSISLINKTVSSNSCLVENVLQEIGRPTFDCDLCANLTSVPVLRQISRMAFLKKFAFTGVPVLIKGAASHWKAIDTFNYDWLQSTYDNVHGSYDQHEINGQFFPYKTEFKNLEEALHMSDERRNKSWYFGWSNVQPEIVSVLRSYYKRPIFLPQDGEDSATDWIFMGTSGKGANVHLDNVERPSWQAQLSGKKTWYLFPSPECQDICHQINATMETGDIIIVDTNVWYHSTSIAPGVISITIGSEYD